MFLKNQRIIITLALCCLAMHFPNSVEALQGQNGQPDFDRVFRLSATKQVVQPAQPGIVGLDLLIFPNDYPLVQGVFPGTSAAQQGVQPGDRIVQIDHLSTMGKSRSQVDEMIPDRVGTRVQLLISREQQLKSVTLTVLPAPSTY
jgi:S1-C subfamily serine protease